MPPAVVTAQLSIEATPRGVLATLTFTNASRDTVLIERWHALTDAPLEADVFEITAGRTKLRYRGPMVKRARPGPADYVRLEPGKTLQSPKTDVTAAYDFPAGAHRYKAQYIARVTYPDRDGFWTLKSNAVVFTYRK